MSPPAERPTKKRRLAFGRACAQCRQKKHRCDGGRPECLGCRSRGLQCQYSPGNEKVTVPSTANLADADNSGLMGGRLPAVLLGESSGETASQVRSVPIAPSQPPAQPNGYFGDSSSFKFVSRITAREATEKDPDSSGLSSATSTSSSLQTAQTQALHLQNAHVTAGIPPRELANQLVDAYFERVHLLYPFLHEGRFRCNYEHLWMGEHQSRLCGSAWLAIVNLIFAYGQEFCCAGQQEDFGVRAKPFIERAKSIIFAHVFKDTNLHLVQALLLLCHYLQGTLELNECWNLVGLMIRSALAIGLHLNPTSDPSLSLVEKEERKRVWWGCFTLDRTLSMKFGRPPSVVLDDAKAVDLPLEIDDQYITEIAATPRQPSGQQPRIAFFNQTAKLSEVVDSILSKLYYADRGQQSKLNGKFLWSAGSEESTKVAHAVLLDGQLRAWWDSMPPHLRVEPDLPDGKDFQRQRLVMRIRFLQMRLLLQRPCFLLFSKGKVKEEFLKAVVIASSKVCVSAARDTIELIHKHYDRRLLNSLWYNLHYVFTSLGVLITVQSMEQHSRTQLTLDGDLQVLRRGMEFLRSVTASSVLASRYVALLTPTATSLATSDHDLEFRSLNSSQTPGSSSPSLHRDRTDPRRQHQPPLPILNSFNTGHPEVIRPDPHRALSNSSNLSVAGSAVGDGIIETNHTGNALPGFDFSQIDMSNSYNLLFGTGLPEEFVPTHWPSHNAMM